MKKETKEWLNQAKEDLAVAKYLAKAKFWSASAFILNKLLKKH